jgi:hypothetical protein
MLNIILLSVIMECHYAERCGAIFDNLGQDCFILVILSLALVIQL